MSELRQRITQDAAPLKIRGPVAVLLPRIGR
jgi:hypothetical protein